MHISAICLYLGNTFLTWIAAHLKGDLSRLGWLVICIILGRRGAMLTVYLAMYCSCRQDAKALLKLPNRPSSSAQTCHVPAMSSTADMKMTLNHHSH